MNIADGGLTIGLLVIVAAFVIVFSIIAVCSGVDELKTIRPAYETRRPDTKKGE